ncbi:MAG: hypothetical protein IJ814_02265 [Paludibacteraceae bacterium]|nr:hypothetical protein [Paludibacteraceae bacterium]
MNILIELVHPAHFYYYRDTISNLKRNGHNVIVAIITKDLLENVVQQSDLDYVNICPISHKKWGKIGVAYDMLVRDFRMLKLAIRHRIDLITGSTIETTHIGWLTRKPNINIGEDDAHIVPMYIKSIAPFVDIRITPYSCNNGIIENKSVHFPGFWKLAYLHPNVFSPEIGLLAKYKIDHLKPYFLIRFAKLNAHHDKGVKGISTEVAQQIIDILSPHGQIFITSERELEPQFEQYRLHINPLDMHHVMAFASLYIGDSQTMAAESGVLGVPFVRFNDFVGRIGYLRELEDKYELGYGIHATPLEADSPIRRADGCVQPSGVEALYKRVEQLVTMDAEKRRVLYQQRRMKMLSEKIDCAKFLTWFIENYPRSAKEVKGKSTDDEFWLQFK